MSGFFNTVFLIIAGAFLLWLIFYLFYFAFTPSNKKYPGGKEKKI